MIRTVKVTRYITPLREGGSLPAISEADDEFLYVLKFRGAGQGSRALIADFIGGELARAAGLLIPEIVFAELDEAFGRTEPDEEIQDLLKASKGLNFAIHFLSGAITYEPAVTPPDAELASKIVWLDAFLANVDRTARNTNMLNWHNELWLIDHGACLYYHHAGEGWQNKFREPFSQIKDHVLLPLASQTEVADTYFKTKFNEQVIRNIVTLIPDEWLENEEDNMAARNAYTDFLINRLNESAIFTNQILHARTTSV